MQIGQRLRPVTVGIPDHSPFDGKMSSTSFVHSSTQPSPTSRNLNEEMTSSNSGPTGKNMSLFTRLLTQLPSSRARKSDSPDQKKRRKSRSILQLPVEIAQGTVAK